MTTFSLLATRSASSLKRVSRLLLPIHRLLLHLYTAGDRNPWEHSSSLLDGEAASRSFSTFYAKSEISTDAFSNDGRLTKPKYLAINKIGHYLHELSPKFRAATFSDLHKSIAKAIGFHDARVLQSMVICKQPEIGGAVPPHQDSTFLYTNPPSAVGFWIALEDATIHNGCLSFASGSHKRAPIKSRFVKKEGGGTAFEAVTGAQFPEDVTSKPGSAADGKTSDTTTGVQSPEAEILENENAADEEEYRIGAVKAGTLVLIHGNLLHKSEKNLSRMSRFIYTFHVIEGKSDYDEKNWLQPPEGGFSRLYRA